MDNTHDLIAEPMLADARLSTEEEYLQQLQQQSDSCLVGDTPEPEKPQIEMGEKIQSLSRPHLKSAAAPKEGDCEDPEDSESNEQSLAQQAQEEVSNTRRSLMEIEQSMVELSELRADIEKRAADSNSVLEEYAQSEREKILK